MIAKLVEFVDVGPGEILLIKGLSVKNLVSEVESLFELRAVFNSLYEEPAAFDIEMHFGFELPQLPSERLFKHV
jgi:hypothetical protein